MSTVLTPAEAFEAFRGFLVLALAGDVDGTYGVITAAQKVAAARRPEMPYFVVDWRGSRALSSVPYTRVGDEVAAGAPTGLTHEHIIQQVREGTVRVTAYGDDGPGLLESLPLRKIEMAEQKYLNEQRIAIRPFAEVLNTAEMRDTTWEASGLQDWAVTYTTERIGRIGIITEGEADTTQ